MKAQVPLTVKAARMRLSRLLAKISHLIITTRADAPVPTTMEKYTIIDENKEIVTTSAVLTPLLKQYDLIREWEYIVGEETEAVK